MTARTCGAETARMRATEGVVATGTLLPCREAVYSIASVSPEPGQAMVPADDPRSDVHNPASLPHRVHRNAVGEVY